MRDRACWAAAMTVGAALMLGCPEKSSSRAQKQLEELQAKKDAKAKADREPAPAPVAAQSAKLDPPYDDSNTVVTPDGPCPDGMWALVPGLVPGETAAEKKANNAKRAAVAESVKGRHYMLKLRAPNVKLSPFDAAKGQFTIEVIGTIDCTDPATNARIALAWTDAKSAVAPSSAVQEGSEVTPHMWVAPAVSFNLPMKSQVEAKEFMQKNAIGLSARVVFDVKRGEVDRKLKKVAKVSEKAHGEALSYGGGTEDWGAGPLVRADLVGLRLATQAEKVQLFELRP